MSHMKIGGGVSPIRKDDAMSNVMFLTDPVGDGHYIDKLDTALQEAIHHGHRVIIDVYDAQQLLRLLRENHRE